MAPPSILESLLTLVMMEGLLAILGEKAQEISHFPTRGCLGDFNATLADTRYKVLQGFLCTSCRSRVEEAIGPEQCKIWIDLLGKKWVGTLKDPTSPATIVSKLGYDMFVTKGRAPTNKERIVKLLRDEGTKAVLALIGAILLAILLLVLGIKQ